MTTEGKETRESRKGQVSCSEDHSDAPSDPNKTQYKNSIQDKVQELKFYGVMKQRTDNILRHFQNPGKSSCLYSEQDLST